jgi:hypothetical protein
MPPLKSLFAILALGALSATAAPAGNGVEAGTIIIPRQGVARVWACSDIDWKGDCRRFENLLGQCCKSKLQLFNSPCTPCPQVLTRGNY